MITYIFDDHVLKKNNGEYQLKRIEGLNETETFPSFNEAIAKLFIERVNKRPTDQLQNTINQTLEAMLLRSEIKRLSKRKKQLLGI